MSVLSKIQGTLLYVQIEKPVKALQKAGAVKADEWKASVAVVDEDLVDEIEAEAAACQSMISCKKIKAVDFEAKYKVPPPEGAGKNVWVLTFRKSTELGKTGKPVPDNYRPRVYQKVGNVMKDVTFTTLPANGSKGFISIDRFERSDGSCSFYLKNVLVTDMIEWVRQEGEEYAPGSEFEDEVPAAKPKADTPAKSEKAAPKAKKEVPPADDGEDDQIPF